MAQIKSMTGYGRNVETRNGREFTVELRSVNNRYLDCSVRLPRMLTFADMAKNAREVFARQKPTRYSKPKPGVGMWE